MRILFLFLDGIGLGAADPKINPFVIASLPNLDGLLEGRKLVLNEPGLNHEYPALLLNTPRLSLLRLDPCLGVEGLPQSATGQAALMTGKNIPAMLGYHDGPKPNPSIMEWIKQVNLCIELLNLGKRVALLNAFPPRYFDAIESGYRIPGVIALTMQYAGVQLKTRQDLLDGNAISADFTAAGWRDHLGYPDTPVLTAQQAGKRLSDLANQSDFSLFEYWLTDTAGHHQDMQSACDILQSFDSVLGGLLEFWHNEEGLILLTSDHGNLEDLSTRHHTLNPVPLLIVGASQLRDRFITYLQQGSRLKREPDLTNLAPAIIKFLS